MAERAVGDVVAGRYEVRGVIGTRPLGGLYRAYDREIGIEAALRIVSPELVPDEVAKNAFVQKLQRGRALQHPNLLRLYDVFVDGAEVIVAVQWAPGETLAERITGGPLAVEAARPLLRQVVAAVTHAHQHGVVLGDLRAETVVVVGDAVKVANIGIGPALPRNRYLEALRDTTTWPRLAPELRTGSFVDARADIHSLGVLTAELLTGKLPERPLELPGLPQALARVIERAIADEPLGRQASAEAFGHELEAVLGGPRPASAVDSQELTLPGLRPLVGEPPPSKRHPAREEPTRPGGPKVAALAALEATRQIDEEELRRLQGLEVTRRIPEEELLPLRLRSSDTQKVALEVLAPSEGDPEEALDLDVTRDPDGTFRSVMPPSPSEPNAARTEPAPFSDADEAKTRERPRYETDGEKTLEMPRLEPEVVASDAATTLEVPRVEPEAIASDAAPTLEVPRVQPVASDVTATLEVPRVEPEVVAAEVVTAVDVPRFEPDTPLPPPVPAAAVGGDAVAPRRVDQPPPAGAAAEDPLRPRSREVVVNVAPTPPPLPPEFKIEIADLPVEVRPREPAPPPPRPPGPPSASPPAAPPPATRPKPRETGQVPSVVTPRPARRTSPVTVMASVLTVLAVVTGIVLIVVSHMRDVRQAHERAEKQRLADALKARADALRHQAAPSPGAAAAALGHPARSVGGPCPLGANLVDLGKTRYCIDVYEYPGGKTIPRAGVSFAEAERLCALRGQRLCTDLEWERACRGKGGASFPYGATFDASRCNTRGEGGEIVAAGSFKDCRSGSGAYDMSGNVAEWVTLGATRTPAQKGGSAQASSREARCSHTVRPASGDASELVGFRCCADPR